MGIKSRIAQVKSAFANKRNHPCSKKHEHKSEETANTSICVALCGCETRVVPNKAEQKLLESFEVRCSRRMTRVSRTERRTTDQSVLIEANETKKMLGTIKDRRWNMIGHVRRHEEELRRIIIDEKINGKRDRRTIKRTSYAKKTISDAGLTNHKELKTLADNRDERK